MTLGNSLTNARQKSGHTQEQIAEKLGVSRQTISKWELDETLPDIRQAKKLAQLYQLSLDDLIDFDADVAAIQTAINTTSDAVTNKVNWTQAWGQKYPVLTTYQQKVDTRRYTKALTIELKDLEHRYGYSKLDAFLVLKDILVTIWKDNTD